MTMGHPDPYWGRPHHRIITVYRIFHEGINQSPEVIQSRQVRISPVVPQKQSNWSSKGT